MYLLKCILIAAAAIACTGTAAAQAKTAQKIEEIGNSAEKINNTVDKMRKILPWPKNKKTRDSLKAAAAAAGLPAASSRADASGTGPASLPAATGVTNTSQAGKVAENAKVLEVDKLGPFAGGAAIIQKGNATALIDAKGALIVPFNQYELKYFNGINLESSAYLGYPPAGIFLARKNDQECHLINAKGKLIAADVVLPSGGVKLSEDNSLVYIPLQGAEYKNNYTSKDLYVDENGNKYLITGVHSQVSACTEGMVLVYRDYKVGYKNLKNELIIPCTFDEAFPFSEGMAIVGKKNEFGEMKYGFIDKKGTLVIPCSYSFKPSHFSSGLARVRPKPGADFTYAFINKKGEIVIKLMVEKGQGSKPAEYFDFVNGYAVSGDVMDSTGQVIPGAQFLQNMGITDRDPQPDQVPPSYEGNYQSGVMRYTSGNLHGIIDLKTKKWISAVFDEPLYFDPVSGLARASTGLRTGMRIKNRPVVEGYINKEGEFVIIKGKGSDF